MQVRITGRSGPASRTITTSYDIQPYEFPIFNFGLAIRGPLDFPGNPTVAAVNSAWQADIFVDSPVSAIAVQVIGNTNFNGEVNIGNSASNVDFQSDVLIAGNMNAQIKGTIINYSDNSTVVEGNATMNFDRVDSVKIPAGFDLYRELDYEPASYSETGP